MNLTSEVTVAKGETEAETQVVEQAVVSVVDTDDKPAANESSFSDLMFLDEEVSEEVAASEVSGDTSISADMSELMDDEQKSVNGVWLKYKGNTEVLVARSGNSRATAMLSRLYTANRSIIDVGGDKSEEISKRIYLEIEAKCIVLGFRNMTFAGEVVEYSPKAALFFLKKSTDFRSWVTKQSQTTENYARKASAEDIESAKKLFSGS